MTWTGSLLASIKIGYDIHLRLIDEGRRETAARTDGTRVMCYLDHDLIGSGKLPFCKWDSRSKEITRKFSAELTAEIRRHADDLKVYFRYVKSTDSEVSRPPAVGSSGGSERRHPTGGSAQ